MKFIRFLKSLRVRQKNSPITIRHIIPSMLTSGHLFCGMFSIILAFNGRFVPAAWMVIFALIFDVLDGRTARLLKSGSQFGQEYDSLSDLVSFGVAPAMILYVATLKNLGIAGVIATAFFALCVALRLARYNVMKAPVGPYQGLPCPPAGLFLLSFIMAGLPVEKFAAMLAFATVIIGFLMLSSVPYSSLKKMTKKSANKKRCFMFLAGVLLTLVLLREVGFMALLSVYLVSGLLRFDWEHWMMLHPEETAEERIG